MALAELVRLLRNDRYRSVDVSARLDVESILRRCASGPLERSLHAWRAHVDAGAQVMTECLLAPADGAVDADGTVDHRGGSIRVWFDWRWILDVWAWGLAEADDCLVVHLVERDGRDRAQVLALAWVRASDGTTRPALQPAIAQRAHERHWHLRWSS